MNAGNPGSSYIWSTGATTQAINVFTSGTYWVDVTYRGCEGSDTVEVIFADTPSSAFIAGSPVCKVDTSTITYTGDASASAAYTWDFDGGTVISGGGEVPYEISWSTDGDMNISLIVEENGCVSSESVVTVTVNPLPPVPTISQNGNVLASSSTSGNQWYFNGVPIGGATQQFYTATQSGFYQVEVTDINGCSSVSDPLDIITDISDAEEKGTINIYPNPAKGTLFVAVNNIDAGELRIELLDITGRVVYNEEHEQKKESFISKIDISAFDEGIYVVRVRYAVSVITEKVNIW